MNETAETYDLNRFLKAQEGVYQTALEELRAGRKMSHWMWYIFPQLVGLGRSYNSSYYGLAGVGEAAAYLQNPVLSARLREVSEEILALVTDNAREVFGNIDAHKLRSSMTLFDLAAPNDIFARVLDKYFDGKRDGRTIALLDE